MKPAPFDYLRAENLDAVLEALAREGEDAQVLAGGQSLLAMLNMRLVQPGLLIDISRIEALSSIRRDGRMLEVGAAVRQVELADWPKLAETVPLLDAALGHVGHVQTRNRGTVCGSIAHADPSSELPLCLATLGGEVVLRSVKGERRLAAAAFQRGMLTTARRADELITAVRFPVAPPGGRYAFQEIARRHGDFAIVAVAAEAVGGTFRLGVGGVAPRPEVREWKDLDTATLDDALNRFAWELDATGDIHATARYRRELVRRLGRRVFEETTS